MQWLTWSNAHTWSGLLATPIECTQVILHFKLLIWGPVVEEVVFRAGLQKYLQSKRIHYGWAIALTSVAFAVAHYVFSQQLVSLAVFFPSLLLGGVYWRTRSLLGVIGLHAAFNLLFIAFSCFRF